MASYPTILGREEGGRGEGADSAPTTAIIRSGDFLGVVVKISYVPMARYCGTMGFLNLWPDIPPFGRITSDVITASQRNAKS